MHYDERHESRWVPRLKKWSYVDTKELESSNKGVMDDEEDFLKIAEENFTAYYRRLIQWVLLQIYVLRLFNSASNATWETLHRHVRSLHDRPSVNLACAHKVVQRGKDGAATDTDDAIVHTIHTRIHFGGPEAEENDYSDVDDGKEIHQSTKDTRATECSPDQLRTRHVDNVVLVVVIEANVSPDAAEEKQGRNREVRQVQARHGHRKDIP